MADNPFGLTVDDIGVDTRLRYQSVFNPDAVKTELEGTIEGPLTERQVYIADEKGRILEVTPRTVLIHNDANGEYKDKKIGEDPEVVPLYVHRVLVEGVAEKFVRAPSSEAARDAAIDHTDYGEMNDMTDANAASRVDDEDVDEPLIDAN